MADDRPTPDLGISEAALAHVKEAIGTWKGDNRDLALAMSTMSHAMLLVLDGRSDHIALYEQAARTLNLINKPQGSA
jgi:hypothetical protein